MCANWLRTRSSMRSMPDPDCRGITVVKVSFGRYTRSARRTSIGPIKKKVRRDARTQGRPTATATATAMSTGRRDFDRQSAKCSRRTVTMLPTVSTTHWNRAQSASGRSRSVLSRSASPQLLRVAIVAISGSVALLADTIHNFSDALTAVPLWIAFALGRRAATRRYTYGFGRAEDLAGLFVLAMIALSAVIAGVEAVRRLINPVEIEHLVG